MRVAVRGFVGRHRIFEEIIEADDADLEKLAAKHAKRMLAYPSHMMEVEFIDEPENPNRFFRFGTDPSRMVAPVGIPLRPKSS